MLKSGIYFVVKMNYVHRTLITKYRAVQDHVRRTESAASIWFIVVCSIRQHHEKNITTLLTLLTDIITRKQIYKIQHYDKNSHRQRAM